MLITKKYHKNAFFMVLKKRARMKPNALMSKIKNYFSTNSTTGQSLLFETFMYCPSLLFLIKGNPYEAIPWIKRKQTSTIVTPTKRSRQDGA